MEKEFGLVILNHEKEISDYQKQQCKGNLFNSCIVFLSSEITALQHMCEAKVAENSIVFFYLSELI